MATCTRCGHEMRAKRGKWNYTESGLDDVLLVGVPVLTCPSCSARAVVLGAVEVLHAVLAHVVAEKPTRLLPKEIRFLRTWLGLSRVDFARVAKTSSVEVNRWESTRGAMTALADRFLRMLVLTRKPAAEYPIEDLARLGTGSPRPRRLVLRKCASNGWASRACAS